MQQVGQLYMDTSVYSSIVFPPINYGIAIRNVPLMKMTPLAKGKTLRGEKAKATMTRRMERDLALNFGLK